MSDYNNGQIHGWNGGNCPVHPETVVLVWLRDGKSVNERQAKNIRWGHIESHGDIIAFQVVKQHVEPKVIWVNEYPMAKVGWDSEADAKNGAGTAAIRIAVKYVEARDD